MTTQNLWDAAKAVVGSLQQYDPTSRNKKTLSRQPNFTPTTAGRRTESPKISRRKEIMKIRAQIRGKEMKETIVKINKTKSWFFKKINKIGRPLTRVIRNKREKNQINKIRNEKGEVTADNAYIQRTIPWDSPGKNTGVSCHFLLQGIFPTQGSNPGLLHCRQILYQLSYEGNRLINI